MIYECINKNIEFWIKLQKVDAESYASIERLKITLESQDNQNRQQQKKKIMNVNPQSSSYISPIFSLQKIPKKSQNSHVNKVKRLLYHNYAKYKTIPFSYTNLYLPKEYISSLVQDLTEKIYLNVVQNRRNFCFMTFGSKQAQTQSLIEGKQGSTEGVYYSALIKLVDMVNKFNSCTQFDNSEAISYTINFLAISQSKIIDLLNLNNEIYVKEEPNSMFSTPLFFENATQCSFKSNYELFTTFKRVIFRRTELNMWNVFIIQVNFCISNGSRDKSQRSTLMLISWVKESQSIMNLVNEKSHQRNRSSFGQKSLLCLNQCILQIYKQTQLRNAEHQKQRKSYQDNQEIIQFSEIEKTKLTNLQCFRNSIITRILKPFLLFNTQFVIMTCCSINEQHQNDSYQSLMLGKHLSKLHTLEVLNTVLTEQTVRQNSTSVNCKPQENIQNKIDEQYVIEQQLKQITPKSMKKNHRKDIKSFHQSISTSPKKNTPSIHQNFSQNELPTDKSLNKQSEIRQKLIKLLEQSKKKQQLENSDKKQINQIQKKIFSEKQKSLKTKKQLNMLKIKVNTKNLRAKLTQKTQNDSYILQQQISRLSFDQKKFQKQVSVLKQTIEEKIIHLDSEKKEQKSPLDQRYIKIQKIRLLKSHLKNELQMTELEINEFLQEKQSIKSIYMQQISLLNHQEKQFIKNLEIQKYKHQNLQFLDRKERNSLPKVRLSKEMEPFYKNSLANKVRVNLSLDKNNTANFFPESSTHKKQSNRYQTEASEKNCLTKSSSLKKKQISNSLDTIDGVKLKQERVLIRKRAELKQKITRGKVDYIKFLQDTTKKYLEYSPKRRQSVK